MPTESIQEAERRRLDKRVKDKLEEARRRIRPFAAAAILWDRVLTPEERQRLGGDPEAAYREFGTAGLWMRSKGVSEDRAVVEAARRIGLLSPEDEAWLLRELGETGEAVLERAIADGGLVLVERPRTAYWSGRPVEVDWHERSALWDYLETLCREAKRGRPLDGMSFGSRKPVKVVSQKNRLKGLPGFPPELVDLIEPEGRGTQRLKLAPERIRLFEVAESESVREWTP